ncbi:hypothetical protein V6Z11_D11G281400 [Gossypium hirsutum]
MPTKFTVFSLFQLVVQSDVRTYLVTNKPKAVEVPTTFFLDAFTLYKKDFSNGKSLIIRNEGMVMNETINLDCGNIKVTAVKFFKEEAGEIGWKDADRTLSY